MNDDKKHSVYFENQLMMEGLHLENLDQSALDKINELKMHNSFRNKLVYKLKDSSI
jgi:hypothetical protein